VGVKVEVSDRPAPKTDPQDPAAPSRPYDIRGDIARSAPDLTPEQRIDLAAQLTPEVRGEIAADAPNLTAEQRIALARESTPEARGRVACYAEGLSGAQRVALANESTPEWRGHVAKQARGLTLDQRLELAKDAGASNDQPCCIGGYNSQADIKPPSPPQRAPGTPANLPRSDQGPAPFRLK